MRLKTGRVLAAMLMLGLMSVLVVHPVAAGETEQVAKVGTVPVTIYELQRAVQKLVPLNTSYHGGISRERVGEIQNEALSTLIERAYKVNAALDAKINVDAKTLENKLDSYRQKVKSKSEFKKALGKEGEKGFRESLKRELLAEAAEKQLIDDRIKIGNDEIKAYYDLNKSTYMRPKQFKASHILIKVDPASNQKEREAILKRATDLAAKAKGGEDFYNLAYYNSEDRSKYVGGDIGYFHEGQTVGEFEAAVQKMQPGEISGPVQTMFGYHIIKLTEVNPARQLSFDEVSVKIRSALEKKQRDKLYSDWITQLKSKYPVQRF